MSDTRTDPLGLGDSATVLWGAGAFAISLFSGYAVAEGVSFWIIAAPIILVLLALAPVEAIAVCSILAFSTLFSFLPGVGTGSTSALIGTLLALAVVIRCFGAPVYRGQGVLGLLAVGSLAFGIVTGISTEGSPSDVVAVSLGFAGVLLVLSSLNPEAMRRMLRWTAVATLLVGLLYVASALGGTDLLPGIYERQQGDLLGLAVDRVYAPGGALFVFGLLWGVSTLAAGRAFRRLAWAVSLVCLLAVAFTLSRTVYLSIACGVLVTLLSVAAFRRPEARRAAIVIAILFAAAALAIGPRLSESVQEIRAGSGNFGVRVEGFRDRENLIKENLSIGVGFRTSVTEVDDPYTFSDSSAVTYVVRFGLLGVVVLLLAFGHGWRRAGRLAASDSEWGREIGALARGMITTVLLASPTTDMLTSPVTIALLAIIFAALHMTSDYMVEEARPRVGSPVTAGGLS